MGHFYIQLEIQVDNEGNRSVIPIVYDNEDDALAKNYTVLAAAAKSTIPYHAGVIMRDDLVIIDGRVFDRRVQEG